MPGTAGSIESDVVESVTLKRKSTLGDGGVFATYRLSVNHDQPIEVEVVDFLPTKWDQIEMIGVHPEFEPTDSAVTESQILFRVTVTPDSESVVKYGIRPVESINKEELSGIDDTHPPTIETATLAPTGEKPENSDTPLVRGGKQELPEILQSKAAFQEAKKELFDDLSSDEM